MWNFFFFFQAVILPTRQQTSYCTLRDRQTDGHKYTEQIQRDRKREKEKGRGPEADFERHACRQVTVTLEDGSRIIQKEELNCKPVG